MDDAPDMVREELDELPRPQLTDLAILWRSYWVQWQDWADKVMSKLRVVKDANILSFGRKGSQKQIEKRVDVLIKDIADLRESLTTEIEARRTHDEPMIAALNEGQDKLRGELEEYKRGHREYDNTNLEAMEVALEQRDIAYALLDRWVYGDALTEDLLALCKETVAVLPPDTRPTRGDQISAALVAMFEAQKDVKS